MERFVKLLFDYINLFLLLALPGIVDMLRWRWQPSYSQVDGVCIQYTPNNNSDGRHSSLPAPAPLMHLEIILNDHDCLLLHMILLEFTVQLDGPHGHGPVTCGTWPAERNQPEPRAALIHKRCCFHLFFVHQSRFSIKNDCCCCGENHSSFFTGFETWENVSCLAGFHCLLL